MKRAILTVAGYVEGKCGERIKVTESFNVSKSQTDSQFARL
jgi:hypothetical protein